MKNVVDLTDIGYTADIAGIIMLPHILAEFDQMLMAGGKIFTGNQKVSAACTDNCMVYLKAGDAEDVA